MMAEMAESAYDLVLIGGSLINIVSSGERCKCPQGVLEGHCAGGDLGLYLSGIE